MVSRPIEAYLNFLRDMEQKFNMAAADEQEANDETQDILHSLELQDHDYHEFARLSKELKVVRQKRRAAKDAMNEMAPVLSWIDDSRQVIKGMERLLGDVRKAEKATENRFYTPKAKKAIKEK